MVYFTRQLIPPCLHVLNNSSMLRCYIYWDNSIKIISIKMVSSTHYFNLTASVKLIERIKRSDIILKKNGIAHSTS